MQAGSLRSSHIARGAPEVVEHPDFLPDAITSLLSELAEILALGVPFKEVIRESTTNPATEIGHPELGQIAVGSIADIAVLRLDHGQFGYADLAGGKVEGTERIFPEMTVRAGKIVFDLNARTAVPWCEGHLKYSPR